MGFQWESFSNELYYWWNGEMISLFSNLGKMADITFECLLFIKHFEEFIS